ncbi:hypothetical protein FQN54_002779 [Arachnomyces sp. PD_36]|nr:hypothetical protein FQN54_002779 [Arachnomyces sp. PD_36]
MLPLLLLLVSVGVVAAEDGLDGWLRYAPLPCGNSCNATFPSNVVALNANDTSPVYVAGEELQQGFEGIFGKELRIEHDECSSDSSVVVGTVDQYTEACGGSDEIPELEEDGFWLNIKGASVEIVGQNERGALYGAFEYLSMLAQGNFSHVAYADGPSAPVRWVNQWDNMDGTIERGNAGPSIFFANGGIVEDLTRVAQYARLLASIRINAVVVNNVNANATLLSSENIDGLGRIADIFRPYGLQLGISLNFASPQDLGGLNTFDPLDTGVITWWTDVTNQIYSRIPDMAGYLVKANSEGQPGPITYNRTLAEGANLFAKALEPHGGIVMFRAFVYDHHLSEDDWYNDRANAGVEFFKHLDGKFDDNVIIQIKYGPIDFQVREPPSPLFANLYETNMAIELQITQEYLGQQCHLVYLPPLWETILDYDLRVDQEESLVGDIVSGKRFGKSLGGYAGVVNVGTNNTWLGSHLAMSNLYAYGRMAWDPTEDSESMLRDWIRLTFGHDRTVIDTIAEMSMDSWRAYENYSGNLGIQTLADILFTHFGPNPASMDGNGWGQWTRAGPESIGMDRTVSNGTGFAGQYPSEIAEMYENIETTPDDLLLWFHHVNYTQELKSGKTVIQHFYDAHYKGAEAAQEFLAMWESLEDKVDSQRFDEMNFRLTFQAGHSIVWRDAINYFYWNLTGIPDEAGRVGSHPWRVEAENMTLSGYQVVDVEPFETASGYQAIITTSDTAGTAETTLSFPSDTYDIAVGYYDVDGGRAQWEIYLNDELLGEWIGNNEDFLGHEPSTLLDGHTATRVTFRGVEVEEGDTLKIVGTPDGGEAAPVDYIAVLPQGIVD